MDTVRLPRPPSHLNDNDGVAAAYGKMLRKILQTIPSSPAPAASLVTTIATMQDAASGVFEAAFLRGKRQAVGYSTGLTIANRLWIDTKLARNNHFLNNSLKPDILGKLIRSQLHLMGTAAKHATIDRSFGSRVQNLYGGVLWTVQEAGYRAGAHHLNEVLQNRSALIQDDWTDGEDLSAPAAQKKKERHDYLIWLAGATGADITELISMRLELGTFYETQRDIKVCGPCGASRGEYWFPDEAPLPGEVCLGGANCRCWIELVIRGG